MVMEVNTRVVGDVGKANLREERFVGRAGTGKEKQGDGKAADVPMARKEPARPKKVAKQSNRPRKTYASRRDYDGTFRDDFFFQPRMRYRDPFSIW